MSEEELIATLQACYFGDKGAYNKILKEYKQLQQENRQLKSDYGNKAQVERDMLLKQNQQLKEDLKYVLEQTLGAFTQNWCIDWNFTNIRDKYSISDTYEWNSGKNE